MGGGTAPTGGGCVLSAQCTEEAQADVHVQRSDLMREGLVFRCSVVFTSCPLEPQDVTDPERYPAHMHGDVALV
jgi:hypothetical protein